jgi:hypothetical protein
MRAGNTIACKAELREVDFTEGFGRACRGGVVVGYRRGDMRDTPPHHRNKRGSAPVGAAGAVCAGRYEQFVAMHIRAGAPLHACMGRAS